MILIDKSKFTVDGVDVYPDHDPDAQNQFWYVPGTIRLSERNGKKVLSYFWYTDSAADSDGTGFLNFEVNAGVSDQTKDKIRAEIARRNPGLDARKITLAPVTYQSGRVNFSVLGPVAAQAAREELEKDASVLYTSEEQLVWSAGSSSLVGDNAAVCSVKFTKAGKLAAAMKQAILKSANTVGAVYRLDFLAMRPSVTFKVHGTLNKTVEEFKASIGLQIPLEVLILDIGVQAAWEKIMQKTDLKIEVVNFSGEEEEGLKWAQQVLLDYMLENFFQVQLGGSDKWLPLPENKEAKDAIDEAKDVELDAKEKEEEKKEEGKGKGKGDGNGDGTKEDATAEAVKQVVKGAASVIPRVNIRAAYYKGTQVNTIDFIYSEMKAKPYRIAPQALVLEGLGNAADRYITQVNRAQDPFGLPYQIAISIPEEADRQKIGLQTVNVQARYPAGAPKDTQTTHNLTINGSTVTGPNPFPFQYDAKGASAIEYSVDYVFKSADDWNTDKLQYSEKGTSDKGFLTALPVAILDFLNIDIRLGSDFTWDDADQVVVSLTSKRWNGEKRVVIQKGQEDPKTFRVRSENKFASEPVQYKVELRKRNKTIYTWGPADVQDKQITVYDRFVDHIPIFFKPAFKGNVESANITISYEDGDFQWEDQFLLEKGAKQVQRLVPTIKELKKKSDLKVTCEVSPDEGDPFTLKAQGGQTVQVKAG
ncbi:MAG TPA: hypothetical protein VJT71_16275 [Pyrinomonadaceae bacterium]|nr:hypothetical protein [Pyrinomonadaceae bacterium]